MPSVRERLDVLDRQIEHARLAIDERRSLVRFMEQQGEDTAEVHRLLSHLQQALDDMIQLRVEVKRDAQRL